VVGVDRLDFGHVGLGRVADDHVPILCRHFDGYTTLQACGALLSCRLPGGDESHGGNRWGHSRIYR
jgi:hypothetical protein